MNKLDEGIKQIEELAAQKNITLIHEAMASSKTAPVIAAQVSGLNQALEILKTIKEKDDE